LLAQAKKVSQDGVNQILDNHDVQNCACADQQPDTLQLPLGLGGYKIRFVKIYFGIVKHKFQCSEQILDNCGKQGQSDAFGFSGSNLAKCFYKIFTKIISASFKRTI